MEQPPAPAPATTGLGVAAAVMTAAVALGLVVAWTAYGVGHLPESAPRVVAGWVLVAGGLVGRDRAPWSRVGWLLVIAGLLWFVGEFQVCLSVEPLGRRCLDLGAGRALADALGWLWLGVLIQASVTLPDGRATTWPRRAAVAAGYAIALTMPAWDGRPAIPVWLLATGVVLAAVVVLGLLWDTPAPGPLTPDRAVSLGGAIAQALRDPGLRIAFHDPARSRWLDPAGHALAPPVPLPGQVTTHVDHDGTDLAILTHDPATLADASVRRAVVLAVELAARNAQLRGDLDAQLQALADSRLRLVSAGLQERAALAGEVATDVERPLSAVAEELARLGEASDALVLAAAELDRARMEIHDLAAGLFPARLAADGLPGALSDLAARAPSAVDVAVTGGPRPDPAVEAAVAFLCAEALANAARHAPGASVRITVSLSPSEVRAVIADDGPGGADPDAGRGSGLRGLQDRIEALGGRLEVASPPDGGTHLTATIPAAGPAGRDA